MAKNKAHDVLGIEEEASIEEIKAAYAELSKKYHPEENPEEFQQIHDAYVTLTRRKRSRNLLINNPIVEPEVDVEVVISTNQQEDSFDFSNVEEAKREEFERKLQNLIKRLDGVVYDEKKIDSILLRRILNLQYSELVYNEKFIEKLIALLQVSLVDNETVRVVKQYMRPWDRALEDKRELLDTLKTVMEEGNKDYNENYATKMRQKLVFDIACVYIGLIVVVSLVRNSWNMLKFILCLSILFGVMYWVYKVCRKHNTKVFGLMIASFSGFVISLVAYFFEVFKWMFNPESAKIYHEYLLFSTALFTIIFFTAWKKGN